MSARSLPRRARVFGWAGLGAGVAIVAVIGFLLGQGGWSARGVLDPESAAPDGARAIARILEQQGVTVRVVRDRAAATAALAGEPATLALPDPVGLTDDAVREVAADAQRIVLLEPRSRTLDLLLDGSGFAPGFADAPLTPQCTLPAARATGPVVLGEFYEPGAGITGCYPGGEGYGLLSDGTTVAVDGRTLLANESLAEEGNAALALGLLGSQPTLVWYLPSPADADAAAPTLGDLTPPWVTPALVLLLAAAVAAMVWRGRRFGPLVAESLPVTVRATETTEGRARLYARSRDTGHAAEQLRAAARERLARQLGLGAGSTASGVAAAVAARTGIDPATVRDLLGTRPPESDRELVDLDVRLRSLEEAVRAALHPERRTP